MVLYNDPQGYNLNNLGTSPLDETMYQISKASASWFQTQRTLKFSLHQFI